MQIPRLLVAPILVAIAIAANAQQNAPELVVRLDAPASLIDLQRAVVHVSVRNAGDSVVRIVVPTYLRNLAIDVTPLQTVSGSRCSAHVARDGASTIGLSSMQLDPGASASAAADLSATYPLGLAPGRYRLLAKYAPGDNPSRPPLQSAPVELTVVEPAASSTYDRMLDVCRALQEGAPEAAAKAVAFVRGEPQYPYPAALLDYARQHSRRPER